MDRIRQLEKFLEEDPDDPFNTYALALEYIKVDKQKAHALFDKLLHHHPDYLPAYYTYAQFLIDSSESQKAGPVLQKGVEIARRVNDAKALKELNNAYSNWLFEQS